MPTSFRVRFLFAIVLLLVTAGSASTEEICLRAGNAGGLESIFHLNANTSSTSAGMVITLTGLVEASTPNVGPLMAFIRDPVTGTAVTGSDLGGEILRVNLVRAGLEGTTIYHAKFTKFFNDLPPYEYYWYGLATVNPLPQGTTLFPQTTEQIVLIDCLTGFDRPFF